MIAANAKLLSIGKSIIFVIAKLNVGQSGPTDHTTIATPHVWTTSLLAQLLTTMYKEQVTRELSQ